MAKGEITVNAALCKGCGLCAEFCPRNCITIGAEKLNSTGTSIAVFSQAERCNACGICGWLCPEIGIEVYKFAELT
ncbi:MAG: 4Fe-4S binding protein [Dehalococcoidia bacterium]|nr:4Fe-4S binding protein [Dehalococcoidia bacterium]